VIDNFLHGGNQTLTHFGVLRLYHWTPFKRFTRSLHVFSLYGIDG
jgi:hypothetical protein